MRIRELQLIKYGRFDGCTLNFAPTACDLHLVLGPNEAGKSTVLAAVCDLLFSFPHRTQYDFRYDRQLLRVGATLEDATGSQVIRRRKGNSQTLLGADDQPISEAGLAALLRGQTRESFERMFGLNQMGLRQGGAAMLAAQDDIGQAIFAAGSGMVQISKVCQALDDEAKAIWVGRGPGASKRFNAAATAYNEAKAQLRDVEVRASRWSQARRALDDAEAVLDASRSERSEAGLRLRTVERKRRVLSSVARRALIESGLEALALTVSLPPDCEPRYEAALQARDQAAAELRLALIEQDALAQSLVGTPGRPEVLSLKSAFDALRDRKASVEERRLEVPQLKVQIKAEQDSLRQIAGEIGWASDGLDALRAHLPARPDIAEVQSLIENRSGIDEQVRAAEAGLEEATAIKDRATEAAAAAAPPSDVKDLQNLIRSLRERALTDAVLRAQSNTLELEGILTARLRALSPWSGDGVALAELILPKDEDVSAATRRVETARRALAEETAANRRDEEHKQQLELERSQHATAWPAPTQGELQRARAGRDDAWSSLKSQLRGGPAVAQVEAAAAGMDAAITMSDRLADERFEAAEHLGRLVAVERELEKVALRAQQSAERCALAQAELTQAAADFEKLIGKACPGLSPDAYPAWRDAVSDALDAIQARQAALRDQGAAECQENDARAALMGALDVAQTSGRSLKQLLEDADGRVEAASEARNRHIAAAAQLEAAELGLGKATSLVSTALKVRQTWMAAWEPALVKARLPSDTGPTAARVRLELIDRLRGHIERATVLELRQTETLEVISSFERQLAELGKSLGLGAVPGDLLGAIDALISGAVRDADRREDLDRRIGLARDAAKDAQGRFATASAELAPLLEGAASEDTTDLRQVLRQSIEAGELHEALRQAESEIVSHGEGRTLQGLIAEVVGADPDILAADADRLMGEIETLNSRTEGLSAAREAAALEFATMGDSPQAAVAAFQMAEARSEMAEQAEQYIRKRAQARLLRAAIERYRQEKQAPLLARASTLFDTLTLGAFRQLVVDFEGDGPRLAGVRADGATVVPVEGMSEGTVDQLFLALRVAAVEDAVDQGHVLPFLADDLFVNFDDERSAAGFRVLAELSRKTQVLFFTHHSHLAEVAAATLAPDIVSVCQLDRADASAEVEQVG